MAAVTSAHRTGRCPMPTAPLAAAQTPPALPPPPPLRRLCPATAAAAAALLRPSCLTHQQQRRCIPQRQLRCRQGSDNSGPSGGSRESSEGQQPSGPSGSGGSGGGHGNRGGNDGDVIQNLELLVGDGLCLVCFALYKQVRWQQHLHQQQRSVALPGRGPVFGARSQVGFPVFCSTCD